MKPTHIEHIGIAVRNLDDAVRFYETLLGIPCYALETVEDQQVKTAFFQVGETKIELLASISPDGPIAKFIEKKGEGVHHIALAVQRLGNCLQEAEAKGVQLIDRVPRAGAEGMEIAFLHPKSTNGVLLELCEKKNS